jgi:hypothetical protein
MDKKCKPTEHNYSCNNKGGFLYCKKCGDKRDYSPKKITKLNKKYNEKQTKVNTNKFYF